MYQGIFDTDFDKYTDDAVSLFTKGGISTSFENLEGFPEDWKTNVPAFVRWVREHHHPSFLEYGDGKQMPRKAICADAPRSSAARSIPGRQVEVSTVGSANAASSARIGLIDISSTTVTPSRQIHPQVENIDMYMWSSTKT